MTNPFQVRVFGLIAAAFLTVSLLPAETPEWCRNLPRPEYRQFARREIRSSWFEAYQVAPSVFAIYEPHQSEEAISYLILGRTKALLFDTGLGIGDIKSVTEEITPLPILVLNSHTHNDHVGGNWQFENISNMDTAFTRQNARGSIEDAQAEIAADEVCGALPSGFDRASYMTRAWKTTSTLHDGEKIDLGGRTVEVIATPGHTPDAISLFDSDNGLLFTGDTYYPGTIWLYRPETDFAAYGASIRKLAALEPRVKMVLGAHNVPVAEPSILPRLVAAYEKVRTHTIPGKPDGKGRVLFKVGDISFLRPAPRRKVSTSSR